ncbi:hypothetical protein AA098_15820 [Pseudomonas sp. JY-Q]|uniref:DUF6119 family protein n=1 Tax=Pseudomonas sp. JY-Q TaxID=1338689 RepID=UPI0007DDCC03|nr:DUF6119 family protein [Pseudomonas sp. JY-Q]ANI34873.1 hypothetical protein AA098_15820 [Pseudomonas sp. JY-Q]
MSRIGVNSITVRLLKPNLGPEDGLSPKYGPSGAKELKGQDWEGGGEGILYYGQVYDRTPEWLALLEPHISDPLGSLHSSGSAAILFLYVQNRWMALCFGYAHLALEEDAFVHQFGLKVALNTVPRGSLLSLDLATPDAVTFQKRIQASKLSDFSQFGMDTLRDLARVAGGQPSDDGFAKFVAGKDALSLDAPLAPSEFHDKCAEILKAYKSIAYKRDYAWFDNVREETSSERLKILDRQLYSEIRAIRGGANSLLHMSPPEILDYQEGAELGYTGFGSRKCEFTKLSITDYVDELNRLTCTQTMEVMKSSHRVRSVSQKSGEPIGWKVYDCLNWECTLTKPTRTHYVLFAGKWYEISATFKDLVEKHFDSIPDFSIIGRTSCLNEEELIADITAKRPDLIKLDRTKINPEGVTAGNLEPCDFYSNDKIFIHLKDGGSSGPISHLWMQGVVSAEAFVADSKFRTKLKDTVSKTKGGSAFLKSLPDGRKSDFNRSDYTVVYGIMRPPYKGGSLGIPFFSKVSFMAACDRLRRTGMKIGKELIEKISPTSGTSTKTKKAKAATKAGAAKPSKAP